MYPTLTDEERGLLNGQGGEGVSLAMRILVESARLLGAEELTPISSAHIDGCLYHGDSGTLFAEKLVDLGARVSVYTTLNVGALDLLHPGRDRLPPHEQKMARRMMKAYVALGCIETWTCAPYQAGHRPKYGQDVAFGESNAIAFCNSVLGARTNRYGDFLDICAAICGRVPRIGLHITANRRATILVDASGLPPSFFDEDIAFAILGYWLGLAFVGAVVAFDGLIDPNEDHLKALGAAAASSGSIGLFHVIGVTPEAPTRDQVFGGVPPQQIVKLDLAMLERARNGLSTIGCEHGARIDAVAIGSPHLSAGELRALDRMLAGRKCQVPFYACTSRNSLQLVTGEGLPQRLEASGVVIVADTCIVVTPILPASGGVLVTNSGKFAHYTPSTTGYEVLFANLRDCVQSAIDGRVPVGCGAGA